MITDPNDYNSLLYKISDENNPTSATLLPRMGNSGPIDWGTEPLYEIDLNLRKIKAPDFIGVRGDHEAEIIYFRCARYYDATDLASCVCVVQYINAVRSRQYPNGEGYLYVVPFIDIETLKDTDEIIIPWVISRKVTSAIGDVQFSLRFYKVTDKDSNKDVVEGDYSGREITYSLSTQPAKTRVYQSINNSIPDGIDSDYILTPDDVSDLLAQINKLKGAYEVFWIDL